MIRQGEIPCLIWLSKGAVLKAVESLIQKSPEELEARTRFFQKLFDNTKRAMERGDKS